VFILLVWVLMIILYLTGWIEAPPIILLNEILF
jgi:hypothetical protein